MEMFGTIQGEGHYCGQAAFFIRLAGCDVGCVWCDVKDSWDAALHPELSVQEIVDKAADFKSEIVVITGGEPAMYDLTDLCNALHSAGKKIHIETSGAHPVRGKFDWITLSPKKFKFPVEGVHSKADELKIIIFNRSDFQWAEEHAAKVSAKCKLYLQPEWDKREQMIPEIVSFVIDHPNWIISLQDHKYMNIP